MTSIEQIKDSLAHDRCFNNWEQMLNCDPESCIELIDKAMKLYANQKLDEAAKKATLKIERNGKQIFKGNYAIIADDADHIEIDKQSILSLKDEV